MAEDMLFADDDVFSDDASAHPHPNVWRILIADDEPDVHRITRMVLSGFQFDGRRLELISAYSGEETRQIMAENHDIAMILLDVVMEDDHAGLEVARYIREELNNRYTRIVLRTGQPGQAPEHETKPILAPVIEQIPSMRVSSSETNEKTKPLTQYL